MNLSPDNLKKIDLHSQAFIEHLKLAEELGYDSYQHLMVKSLTLPNGKDIYLPPLVQRQLRSLGYWTSRWYIGFNCYLKVSRNPLTLKDKFKAYLTGK